MNDPVELLDPSLALPLQFPARIDIVVPPGGFPPLHVAAASNGALGWDVSPGATIVVPPPAVSVSTLVLTEGSPFTLGFPATSSNPVDFCARVMMADGRSERVLLAADPTSGLLRGDLAPGSLSGAGNLMVAEGAGQEITWTTGGPLQIDRHLVWTAAAPPMQPVATVQVNGDATDTSGSCVAGTCVSYYGTTELLTDSTVKWTAVIPAAVVPCFCSTSTQVIFDLHGDYKLLGDPGHFHFDEYISGSPQSPGAPVASCLSQIVQDFIVAMGAADPDITVNGLVSTNAAGDAIVTITLILDPTAGLFDETSLFGSIRACF